MEVSFETVELRDLCEDESLAAEKLGSEIAESLKHRLSDLFAADSIHDVLVGRPALGTFNGRECLRIELAGTCYMTMVPNHSSPRVDANGATNWDLVRRLMLVSLGD